MREKSSISCILHTVKNKIFCSSLVQGFFGFMILKAKPLKDRVCRSNVRYKQNDHNEYCYCYGNKNFLNL